MRQPVKLDADGGEMIRQMFIGEKLKDRLHRAAHDNNDLMLAATFFASSTSFECSICSSVSLKMSAALRSACLNWSSAWASSSAMVLCSLAVMEATDLVKNISASRVPRAESPWLLTIRV